MTQPDDRAREAAREILDGWLEGKFFALHDDIRQELLDAITQALQAATRTQAARCEELEGHIKSCQHNAAWLHLQKILPAGFVGTLLEGLKRLEAENLARCEKLEAALKLIADGQYTVGLTTGPMHEHQMRAVAKQALSKPEGGG